MKGRVIIIAWPDPGTIASWDKTSGSFDLSVDSVLWPMLCQKSQLLDRIPRFNVDNTEYLWESANTVGRTVTAADHGGATTFDGHATNAVIAMLTADADKVQEGSILRNVSRATPIGTYGVDEQMQVTAKAAADSGYVHVTVARNYNAPVGSTAANGSTAHTHSDVLEILFTPKPEGSDPSANRYTDVSIVKNWTTIHDFYLKVTGSQLHNKRLLAADNMQRQFDDRLVELKNDLEAMWLYGQVNSAGATVDAYPADETSYVQAGSDSYVRSTRGFQNFVVVSGGNVDYTTKAVTEEAINAQVANIMADGTDMTNKFGIVGHPNQMRVISAFGADKVRVTQAETKWGRALKSFETDLGVELELIPCLTMSKTDLFIINFNKVGLATFRPFQKLEWGIDTSTPDGSDAYKQRYIGELGAKIVDGPYSHAALSYLTWV
jgi:hypothetical protein